jgi:hypothetical protein
MGGNMTLKPNYLKAFLKGFVPVFILTVIVSGILPHVKGKKADLLDLVSFAVIGGAFLGIFVVILTPRMIIWDDTKISVTGLFFGSGEFEWSQLQAWSPTARGTFLFKFGDTRTIQFTPAGFRSDDWQGFKTLLQERFPEKKTSPWF